MPDRACEAYMLVFWMEFALVLGAILIGIRRGGVSLGLIGGLGVAVLCFGFGAVPARPPVTVMLIILAVVTASATLQAAGGLDWLVQQAERLLRAHPKHVTLIAPFCSFALTVCVGSGHAIYSLLPVIADVSLRTGVRPERPMAISSVASQMGITASPVAAAVTTFLAITHDAPGAIGLVDLLIVTVPAGLFGLGLACLWSLNRGLDLDKDMDYQARLTDPEFRECLGTSITTLDKTLPASAKISVILFFSGILTIVMLALNPQWLPMANGKAVPMTTIVQIVMLAYGALIMLYSNVKATDIARSSVFNAGMIAIVSIFGIAWMSDTFVSDNEELLINTVRQMVEYAPLTFAFALFAVSMFVKSQAATLAIMIPFGITLGVPMPVLVGVMPACYAYFFFAFYPSDLAAINMDRTGTTRIGKYLLNHSFMMPGLIGVWGATVAGWILASLTL
ncbi:anaerobic C4-dicarboxylate transporter [Haematospirillum sp. H1815]|uniref:anaerobic C4-dicarboxylate transporter n=1 Tax=Haematospirillum sp. H1815 TaxID=2723108 RepID=UPI001ADE7395|nr:anaerobic C4-dicarboxylate transporter [Haematospirillum sp. H1815]